MNIDRIAKVCHEANRAFCESIGDLSQKPWDEAPEWQKESARNGVQFLMDNPEATLMECHSNWLSLKQSEGWKWGPLKDVEAKEHPAMLSWNSLPEHQKIKDLLFKSIVDVFTKPFIVYI